ncbi:hypothetical protein PG995_015877 [Apiospora arundinis]
MIWSNFLLLFSLSSPVTQGSPATGAGHDHHNSDSIVPIRESSLRGAEFSKLNSGLSSLLAYDDVFIPGIQNEPIGPFNPILRRNPESHDDGHLREAKDVAGRHGVILIVTCILLPIATSLLSLVPLPRTLSSRILAHLESPVFGSYHAVPVLGLGFVPTRGQSLSLVYVWGINIALLAAAYPSSTSKDELVTLFGYRSGLFSFVNIALAVLYASRNSVLLYLTNWSHATFLLLHRWIAVLAIFEALIHAAIFLHDFRDGIFGPAATEFLLQSIFWRWGLATLVAMWLLIPTASLPIRQRFYEVFLASHVVLSALVLTGCSLHIFDLFGWKWGYLAWIVGALAIWGFDRLVARPYRLIRAGIREARISVVDCDYLMIEVPGVEAEGYAYLYFPSLSWRFWENHPFSVAAVNYPPESRSPPALPSAAPSPEPIQEKGPVQVQSTASRPGIVFFVRRKGGLTKKLCQHAGDGQGLKTLVESSYGGEMSFFQRRRPSVTCSMYPNLVCLAGGVGITAMLPLIKKERSSSSAETELYWGLRSAPLVEAVAKVVGCSTVPRTGEIRWGQASVFISVGTRFDFKSILEDAARRMSGGITVSVCGPEEMSDEVRSIVTTLGKGGIAVKLHEESFAW